MSVQTRQIGEVVQIRVRTQRKIKRLVKTLFPDFRLVKGPLIALRYHGDVFTTMMELEKAGCFRKPEDKELGEKRKIATETALLMFHPRVETHITAYPESCHLYWIRELIRPWYLLTAKDLREIRSEVIAMHSEGFPL